MIATSYYVARLFGKLRSPCARTTRLLYTFSNEGHPNLGYTLEFPSLTEPAVAPGDGTVKRVERTSIQWRTSAGLVQGSPPYLITINHGEGIETQVGGLAVPQVHAGQVVQRGDALGLPQYTEIFFAIHYNGAACRPADISRHFQIQDQQYVTGQSAAIRFAPDRIARDLAEGITTAVTSGIRYFANLLNPSTYLLNVDFNGSGLKSGLAAAGVATADFWNVYTPVNFTTASDYACGYGLVYNSSPVVWLSDWRGIASAARLEKLIEPQAPYFGSGSSWDAMLASWIGGYVGLIPVETFFVVRGLPAGNYQLYLYSNQGATDFMVSVNAGPITTLSNSPTVTPAFVLGQNYVRFSLSVPLNGIVNVKSFGYLSGMQVLKI